MIAPSDYDLTHDISIHQIFDNETGLDKDFMNILQSAEVKQRIMSAPIFLIDKPDRVRLELMCKELKRWPPSLRTWHFASFKAGLHLPTERLPKCLQPNGIRTWGSNPIGLQTLGQPFGREVKSGFEGSKVPRP
ncbi:hypothetical protein ACH5RR_006887 [Cinchona calisaya]|uniref:Uncharacterized protein n=1 Tax=Cinchona calisaya TaxID=153742 RepID=A0ABD3AQB3_9GENT